MEVVCAVAPSGHADRVAGPGENDLVDQAPIGDGRVVATVQLPVDLWLGHVTEAKRRMVRRGQRRTQECRLLLTAGLTSVYYYRTPNLAAG